MICDWYTLNIPGWVTSPKIVKLKFDIFTMMVVWLRAGVWGEKHPVTDHYYPKLRLPESIRKDLDAVFLEVYGWKNCWKALNRCWPRYRLCYRMLENSDGLLARLARKTGHPLLKSLAYSESHFNGEDVENRKREEWAHSHEAAMRSREISAT